MNKSWNLTVCFGNAMDFNIRSYKSLPSDGGLALTL